MAQVFRETKTRLCFENCSTMNFPPHIHEDIELVYVRRGSGNAYCDGHEYPLCSGRVFLAFPNQVHHYMDFQYGGEYLLLIVKPERLLHGSKVFLEGLPQRNTFEVPPGDPQGIVRTLEQALSEFESGANETVVSAYLTALFGKLLPHFDIQKNKRPQDSVSSILDYCSRHFSEPISVGDVACALHISRSHVSHIFSRRLKINFCDYINSLRLAEALKMLETEHSSMTEIADRAGFSTIRTFNRAFQKRFGVSPSAYRRDHPVQIPH